MSLGNIYNYFPTKAILFEAVLAPALVAIDALDNQCVDLDPTSGDWLVSMLPVLMRNFSKLVEQFHAPGNAEFHLLSITAMIEHLTPVLADVVAQGVNEGIFTTDRPHDAVELLLSASGILLDHEIMEPSPDELARRRESLIWASETLLGARPGSLSALVEVDS